MQEITKRACKVTVHGQAKQQKSKHRERKKYVRNNTHTRLNAVQITAAKCLREKDFHLVTKKKNKPKTKLKDEGIGKEKKSTKRCDGLRAAMDPKQTEPYWTESYSNPNPNQTRPGLATSGRCCCRRWSWRSSQSKLEIALWLRKLETQVASINLWLDDAYDAPTAALWLRLLINSMLSMGIFSFSVSMRLSRTVCVCVWINDRLAESWGSNFYFSFKNGLYNTFAWRCRD